MIQETLERYIEIIRDLEKEGERAHTKDIAEKLRVREPSVTEMLQKLKEKELVKYKPYQGAILTSKGQKLAIELTKKHATLAGFLKMLGLDEKIAETDACKIEHIVDPKTMEKLRKFLEFIKEAPKKPIQLEHYEQFLETGEYLECDRRKKGNSKNTQ